MADTSVYEKLGAFYLGKEYDPDQGEVTDDLVLYDSKDLTTHAVCVGMTGSGKTGLCISLLEEAAIDGIPAICIDPKGDISNLLLGFPNLAPDDFLPWVDPSIARQKEQTAEEFAASQADLWKNGIGQWGQDGERIRAMHDRADFTIYTPGSASGLPVSVLSSFKVPDATTLNDPDARQERIDSAVGSLLALLGEKGDSRTSQEQIFLSTLINHAWQSGRDLDLSILIREIMDPPFDRIGVMDLDMVYPQSARQKLAMKLNGLVASPGFQAWLQGAPLDMSRMMVTAEGKPRITIFSIAHLNDDERMFFVTLLLNEMLAWMRKQSGTSALRALLYMDEVFGYFPPSKNPPSKQPMLTLLKQARAFGLGCVLATQNPVDLDYKGLSNCGTWFLGRLQTERDKARVLDGLEGASAENGASFDRKRIETILSGMKGRVFLMNNVHDKAPTLFHTRWCLSYLRGPITRDGIQTLMADKIALQAQAEASTAGTKPAGKSVSAIPAEPRPLLPDDVEQAFMPVIFDGDEGMTLRYEAALLGRADLEYGSRKHDVDHWQTVARFAPIDADIGNNVWDDSEALDPEMIELETEPASEDAAYAALPKLAQRASSLKRMGSRLKAELYKNAPLELPWCAEFKMCAEPGEDVHDFQMRLLDKVHVKRDAVMEKLRKRYQPKLDRLMDRIAKAEMKVERETEQYANKRNSALISAGTGILGALFGRRRSTSRAGTVMRGMSSAAKERSDIQRAEREVQMLQQNYAELEQEFQTTMEREAENMSVDSLEIETVAIRPKKTGMQVEPVVLVWLPHWVDADGFAEPAYDLPLA